MEYETALRHLGLSDNELKVYVALLELGSAKVDSLAKRVPLPRTTIYGILKALLEKGLASYVVRGGIKHYESTDPQRLLLIEQEKIQELKRAIPKLEQLKQTVGEKPSIELYEGKEGIKSVYEDMLRTKQTVYGYGNTSLLFQLLEYYIPNYIQRRTKAGIRFCVITEKSPTAIEMKKRDKQELRETRFIPKMKDTTIVTYVYGHKVAQMTLLKKNPIGVLIGNEDFAHSQKVIFDILWTTAKS